MEIGFGAHEEEAFRGGFVLEDLEGDGATGEDFVDAEVGAASAVASTAAGEAEVQLEDVRDEVGAVVVDGAGETEGTDFGDGAAEVCIED